MIDDKSIKFTLVLFALCLGLEAIRFGYQQNDYSYWYIGFPISILAIIILIGVSLKKI